MMPILRLLVPVIALAWCSLVHGAPAAAPVTFPVVIRDGRIVPAELEVPTGVKIKLTLHNQGPGPCEFENLGLRVEKVLAPMARSFVVIHPLPPGRYRFIDEFHPDTGVLWLVVK